MCTLLLPPSVNPIADNKYINKDALSVRKGAKPDWTSLARPPDSL